MLYGSQGLMGALIGAGTGVAMTSEEGDPEANALTGSIIGGTVATVPKPAIAWAGKNMRNFSAGYYDQDPLKNLTKVEKLIGNNKGISIKRNLESAVRGTAQKYDPRAKQALLNLTPASYKKIVNPTQFEDLQVEINKLKLAGPDGRPANAVDEFRNYKKQFGGLNSTPEEAIWWHKKENAKLNNSRVDNAKSALDYEDMRNNEFRRTGQMNQAQYDKATIDNFQAKRELNKQYERFGEADRKWRHEIAKSESHAMWANKNWSNKRLQSSGYKWEGAYRWGDVKNYMQSVGGAQWEADLNKYANKVSNNVGVKTSIMLNDNTPVNVMRNVNVQDMKVKRKPSRVFQRMGRDASLFTFDNPQVNKPQVLAYLKSKVKDNINPYRFTLRDIRDYGESAGKQYNGWLNKYLKLNKYRRSYSPEGKLLWERLTTKYGNNEATKIVNQMKAKGAFRAGSRGVFQLSGIGRVTNSYLEGGINATSDFVPFKASNNQTKVAMRMVTSDLSDLPMSGHTGIQRNIPFIIEEEIKTYDGRSGKEIKNLTKDNPFIGRGQDLDIMREKKLVRGDVKNYVMGKHSKRDKIRYLKRKVVNNPKHFLKYAAKRIPGVAFHPATQVAGVLAWYLIGQDEGNEQLASID